MSSLSKFNHLNLTNPIYEYVTCNRSLYFQKRQSIICEEHVSSLGIFVACGESIGMVFQGPGFESRCRCMFFTLVVFNF